MNTLTQRRLLMLALAGLALPLSSCSLLVEAVVITARQSKEVRNGTPVQGDGFVVICPEDYLYPTQDIPTQGGVTFRPTSPMNDGDAYFVTPFKTATASTPEQALLEWNLRPRQKIEILKLKKSVFRGLPAVTALVHLSNGERGSVASMTVVKRATDYLVIARGAAYDFPGARQNTINYVERQRAVFELCISPVP